MGADFGKIGFSGALRPSQVASSSIIERELESDSKELLIVAPPGSGKTVLGLYVWSDLVRLPTLVLSPNSAIQAQWIARAKELFHLDGREEQIGTDPKNPGILTSLTYQSITLPKRGGEGLDDAALELWISKLMTPNEADGSVEAEDRESALAWIADLEDKNPDYHSGRLGHYRKKVRDDFADHGNALWVLHESAKANLMRLSEVGIGLIILDECHHLMEHWGKVLIEAREFLGNPIVLGLTEIALTKLDILNGFEEVPVCVAYDVGGEQINEIPASLSLYRRARPVYKTLPGWGSLPENIWDKGYDKIPKRLKDYIGFIEREVGCPIKIISVGPQRHETIIR